MMWQKRVINICRDADEWLANNDAEAALEFYLEAQSILPPNVEDHLEATRVLAGVAECYFQRAMFREADPVLRLLIRCPGAAADPFIRLRRGQVAHKLGRTKQAYEELTCAYMNGGPEIFDDQPSDYHPLFSEIIEWGKQQ